MLAQHVHANVLGHLDVICQGSVSGRSVQPICKRSQESPSSSWALGAGLSTTSGHEQHTWPEALVQHAHLQRRSPHQASLIGGQAVLRDQRTWKMNSPLSMVRMVPDSSLASWILRMPVYDLTWSTVVTSDAEDADLASTIHTSTSYRNGWSGLHSWALGTSTCQVEC